MTNENYWPAPVMDSNIWPCYGSKILSKPVLSVKAYNLTPNANFTLNWE